MSSNEKQSPEQGTTIEDSMRRFIESVEDILNKSHKVGSSDYSFFAAKIKKTVSKLLDATTELAKPEVMHIEKAFAHIIRSSHYHRLYTGYAFKFYGYAYGTPHYRAIRELKLTPFELKDKTCRVKFLDKALDSKNLERYIAVSDFYYKNIFPHYTDFKQPIVLDHLKQLLKIAEPLVVSYELDLDINSCEDNHKKS